MKEFAMNALWVMIAVVCISITINVILYPFIQAFKEKNKQNDLDTLKELAELAKTFKDDTNEN